MNETKKFFKARVLAEIVVFAALSTVLYVFRPFSLPYGGSITLASMVPVVWLSLRRGFYPGILAGAIFGILALFVDVMLLPFSPIATPIQAIIEYPIAFGVLGIAGIFKRKTVSFCILGLGSAVMIKFLFHYFVGVFFWAYVYEFPTEWGQYLWPAIYNGSFLAVEFVISALILAVLVGKGTLNFGL